MRLSNLLTPRKRLWLPQDRRGGFRFSPGCCCRGCNCPDVCDGGETCCSYLIDVQQFDVCPGTVDVFGGSVLGMFEVSQVSTGRGLYRQVGENLMRATDPLTLEDICDNWGWCYYANSLDFESNPSFVVFPSPSDIWDPLNLKPTVAAQWGFGFSRDTSLPFPSPVWANLFLASYNYFRDVGIPPLHDPEGWLIVFWANFRKQVTNGDCRLPTSIVFTESDLSIMFAPGTIDSESAPGAPQSDSMLSTAGDGCIPSWAAPGNALIEVSCAD